MKLSATAKEAVANGQAKSRKKKAPKRVLALPDLEHAKTAVLNSLTSASGQRTYDHAIREFVAWYCSEPRLAFNRTVVLRYRIHLEQRGYAPATINLRLAAVRRIAYEAADAGLLSPELAAGIRRVKGVRRIGVRLGNWLTPEQGRRLLTCALPSTARELRDHAMVAMLIGCGLRRAELLALRLESIQQREEHARSTRPGVSGATACRRGCSGMWSAPRRLAPALTSWPHTTCGEPAPGSATSRVANWIRSSSCSASGDSEPPCSNHEGLRVGGASSRQLSV